MNLELYGSEILAKPTFPVLEINSDIISIFDQMVKMMLHYNGLGVAANQIGYPYNMAVIDHTKCGGEGVLYMANLSLWQVSEETTNLLEGCLSIPGVFEHVKRPARLTVKYLNRDNNIETLEAEGLLAKAICHEYDHVNGKLFIDSLSYIKKDMVRNKIRKIRKTGLWDVVGADIV